jgi:hypothetical protein
VCCIHGGKRLTEEMLERIRELKQGGGVGVEVEVILAHDRGWVDESGNEGKFWLGRL